MKKVEFSVGAKAARLIGRENIADVDGALMELIKNAYDADASCVMVRYRIPFLEVPSRVNIGGLKEILSENDLKVVLTYYDEDKKGELTKKELSEEDNALLENVLYAYNSIIVADNGCGMTIDTVASSWMYIGTSEKENNYVSPKGRIKTGAKGIGRFALDKLSRCSKMYTKAPGCSMVEWSMDWDQFANVKLISDVEADVDEVGKSYGEIVSQYFASVKNLDEYDWSNGTLIVLSPTRESWSKRLFKKVNTNLRSINPIGTMDKFDVVIRNDLYPDYSYKTEEVAIDSEDYDYRIRLIYDGDEELIIKLQRNEVNLSVKKIIFEKYDEVVEKDVEEFWKRDAFSREHYNKEDYSKEVSFKYGINNIFPNDSLEKIKRVGKFSSELYFMRLDNSDKYPIMKHVARNKRKNITKKFSGIKIYRDSFKVRPYGDEGTLYDWLGLAGRVQKSPAGVAHPDGPWRVQPYQILGWVSIGRENNPLLEDMANREGLALNEYYYIFCDIIEKGISEFEFDRQYIYREFAKWKKEIEDKLGELNKSEQIKEEAKKRKENRTSNKNKSDYPKNNNNYDAPVFTEEEFFGTVQQMMEESEKSLNEKQIMQILSSSGIVLNTFFHEFNAINTQFHVEAPQIRSRVKYILNNQEYTGIPAYNPYLRIDALEKNDRVTAAFLDVIMEGLKKENLHARNIRISEEINLILQQWRTVLEEKHIDLNCSCDVDEDQNDKWNMSKVDLYIILNNFMLNSAWFLEESHNTNRRVDCDLCVRNKYFSLLLKNNGPSLDAKYQYNPNKVFELGETTKSKRNRDNKVVEGTGLGLWILKETVERNNGTVDVLNDTEGFSLRIIINR